MQYELFAAAATSPAQRVPCLQGEIHRELASPGEESLWTNPPSTQKPALRPEWWKKVLRELKTNSKGWGMEETNAGSNLHFGSCT